MKNRTRKAGIGSRVSKIDPALVVMTDERLDALAESYLSLRIGPLLGVTFCQYLEAPDWCEELANHLAAGGGLRFSDGTYCIELVVMGGAIHAA